MLTPCLHGHTLFANFREYLCENEKFQETVFACLYVAQVESFKPKKLVENLVTLYSDITVF